MMTQTTAFLATVALEACVVVAWARVGRERAGVVVLVAAALAANALTHPLLWLADAALAPDVALPVRWTLLELAAVAVEAAAYAAVGVGRGRALALALLANAVSFGAGLAWTVAIRTP